MRAVLVRSPFQTKIVETPAPCLPEGGLLLRNRVCGICGSDVRAWEQGTAGRGGIGHEVVGVVSEVSNQALEAGLKPGMRVIPLPVACQVCPLCLSGNEQMCPNRTHAGFEGLGGFSEVLPIPSFTVQRRAMLQVPDDLDDIQAALCEPLACVLNGQDKLGIGPGKSVCVIGAGPIGVTHAFLARKRGAARVFISDLKKKRLILAKWIGADEYIDAGSKDPIDEVQRLTNGQGADFVIVSCSSPDAQTDAVKMAARLGYVLYFSGLPRGYEKVPIDIQTVHRKEITLVGARNAARKHFILALEMLRQHDWSLLVTHRLSLENTQGGFELVRSGEGLKVVVQIS
ncbi:MAG TPA: zinc-binding dehydrogenase [Firmicutes bacterium]|nr:zinc-binding dehydrogenase [Bacillota bacterium]